MDEMLFLLCSELKCLCFVVLLGVGLFPTCYQYSVAKTLFFLMEND